MTRDDINRMALDAGFQTAHVVFDVQFKRFAELVAAHEREACAKVVEAESHMFETLAAAKSCANEIRARGQG
jgi:hypothetical protein